LIYTSMCTSSIFYILFSFMTTATTNIYTLSLHDALPIYLLPALAGGHRALHRVPRGAVRLRTLPTDERVPRAQRLRAVELFRRRSEEHTSELQSPCNLVCRLLLEKKKIYNAYKYNYIIIV